MISDFGNAPPVSWLMSVHNAMPYLEEALNSMQAQTYPNHQALVYDNCSTDNTLDELRRWIPERIQGKIYEGRDVAGCFIPLGKALAFLVEEAPTEFCARMDGDDVCLPERLALQVAFLSTHMSAGIVGCQASLIDEEGRNIGRYAFPTDDADLRWLLRWQPLLCHPSVMFRKSVILDAGNYDDSLWEDASLWIRVAKITEIYNLSESLIRYRRSKTSMTGQIKDFVPFNREVALKHVGIIFPGLSDIGEIMDLWDVTHPLRSHLLSPPVRLQHLSALRRVAVALAKEVNKDDGYFSATRAFKAQHYHLRKRLIERLHLMQLARMGRNLISLYHRLKPGHQSMKLYSDAKNN